MKNVDQFPDQKNDLRKYYSWQVLILRYSGARSQLHHLYSRISITQDEKSSWTPVGINQIISFLNEQNRSVSIDLLDASFVGQGTEIQRIIKALLSKHNFSEAFDSETTPVPKEFLNVEFVNTLSNIDESFILRPEVMLPTEHLLIPWPHKSIPSPTNFSVFVSQLFYLKKGECFTGLDSVTEKRTLYRLNELVKSKTGIEITKSSAPRLGNVEWYRLPFSNWNYEPYVSFSIVKTDKVGKELRVAIQGEGNFDNLFVRCRLINGAEIISDEIKQTSPDTKGEFSFIANEPISRALVTVWEKGNDGVIKILFEEEQVYIRTFSFDMAIIGEGFDTQKINLFKKLPNKEEKKVEELAKFRRSTKASGSKISSYSKDPWVSISRKINREMQLKFPEPSGGKFFSKGWNSEVDESGHITFFK